MISFYNSVCYEIGSSTGTLIKKLYRRHHDKNNTTFYGIEPVKEMIEVAQSNDDTEIEYINDSIENVNMLSANLIVGYYFYNSFQFPNVKKLFKKFMIHWYLEVDLFYLKKSFHWILKFINSWLHHI